VGGAARTSGGYTLLEITRKMTPNTTKSRQ
jgi:hypothetical protein